MKITKVNYQKAFWIGSYLQDKVGVEIELEEGESPEQVLTSAKERLENWHKEVNPLLYLDLGMPSQSQFREPESLPIIQEKER